SVARSNLLVDSKNTKKDFVFEEEVCEEDCSEKEKSLDEEQGTIESEKKTEKKENFQLSPSKEDCRLSPSKEDCRLSPSKEDCRLSLSKEDCRLSLSKEDCRLSPSEAKSKSHSTSSQKETCDYYTSLKENTSTTQSRNKKERSASVIRKKQSPCKTPQSCRKPSAQNTFFDTETDSEESIRPETTNPFVSLKHEDTFRSLFAALGKALDSSIAENGRTIQRRVAKEQRRLLHSVEKQQTKRKQKRAVHFLHLLKTVQGKTRGDFKQGRKLHLKHLQWEERDLRLTKDSPGTPRRKTPVSKEDFIGKFRAILLERVRCEEKTGS
ncbi:MAG: uncharacterized protein A8A55_1359, partial [Amphiamblys sp. WSBS2006]